LGGTTLPLHNSCVVPLYHSTTVVWYHSTTPQQLCGTTLPLHNSCVVPLYHSTTVVWYHSTTPQQLCGTTIPLHNSCVVPLYHSTTVVWYHYTTPQQLCGTTLPLHNNTPYAPWSSALCLCGFGIVGNSSLEQQASPLTGKCTGAQHVLKCLANADMCSARADVYVVCTRSRAPWSCPPSRHALRL
jgi:hypothetical protein